MKKNNVAFRTCILTKTKAPKENLIRFVIKNNQILLDINHKIDGRGYYLSKDLNEKNFLQIKKIIQNRFKIKDVDQFFLELSDLIGEKYERQENT